MCKKMSDEENQLVEQLKRDNEHFKGLLDLIPPQAYFSQEEKHEIWGNEAEDSEDEDEAFGQKKKKRKGQPKKPLSFMTVTQIAEMRQKGETVGDQNKKKRKHEDSEEEDEEDTSGIAAKHQGKKQSRSSKGKKNKAKEIQRRQARLEELKEKLRLKMEAIRAQKNAGKGGNSQLEKRLKRQEKKVNAKLKNKTNNHKEERHAAQIAHGLRSPPRNDILNDQGVPVKTKFDFSTISFGTEKAKSDLKGRDYKRLLEKVEKRQEKVEKLKEKDVEAGRKLETKLQWQSVMSKAQGEKVKDDVNLLKKAAKRKEKVKERKKKKWGDRQKTVEESQKKQQDKRQANIDKRKNSKMDKKRKQLIKKGRIIPGF